MNVEPGMYVLLDGKLAEVIGIAREPTVYLRMVRDADMLRCECGRIRPHDEHFVIGSRMYQERVKPVETIS